MPLESFFCGWKGVQALCLPYARAKGRKSGKRVVKRWEKPCTAHLCPMQGVGRVGEGWSKGGRRVVKRWEKPCTTHACPMQRVGSVGEE